MNHQHTHQGPFDKSAPGFAQSPGAVPPPPWYRSGGYHPPWLPSFPGYYQRYYHGDYPPPVPQHISHERFGYRDETFYPWFLGCCLPTFCCCFFWEECCWV